MVLHSGMHLTLMLLLVSSMAEVHIAAIVAFICVVAAVIFVASGLQNVATALVDSWSVGKSTLLHWHICGSHSLLDCIFGH